MLISIIMPAYNAASYIRQAIDSIIIQTHANWELLIADDGSKDNTREIVDSYTDARIKTFHNEKNLGYLKTCNKLFALCAGDLITFQDADDWSTPDRLERQLAEFTSDPDLGICGTWAEYIDLNGKSNKIKSLPIKDEDIKKELYHNSAFCGASIMIKSEVYRKTGGYREYFDRIGSEDYDWACQIVERFKAVNIPETLYKVRITANSISRNINDYRKLVTGNIVRFLAAQRKAFGKDALDINDDTTLKMYEESLTLPYKKFRSLMFREAAERSMYSGLKRNAINYSLRAIKVEPLEQLNYRTLFYCLRK